MNNKKQFKKGKGNKKQFGKKNNQKPMGEQELGENMSGFLITCDRFKEKNCIREAYQIIEAHIEKLYPEIAEKVDRLTEQFLAQQILDREYHQNKKQYIEPSVAIDNPKENQNFNTDQKIQNDEKEPDDKIEEQNEEQNEEEEDFENSIENIEFQQPLNCNPKENPKENPKDKRKRWIRESHIKMLQSFDTRVNCLVFIKVNLKYYPEIDIDLLGEAIMNTVYVEKQKISRQCYKFVPIKYVFKADLGTFRKHAKTLIEENFNLEKSIPWLLWFKSRYTKKIQKCQVLTDINNLMEPLHFNDYRDPQRVIFVEVNGAVMYMNILKNFMQFKEYSIRGDFKSLEDDERPHPNKKSEVKAGLVSDVFEKEQYYEEEEVELI